VGTGWNRGILWNVNTGEERGSKTKLLLAAAVTLLR
jgi:hypothetical protein